MTDADATWFREVNTDPRSRVAAGLGAEVMRKYQEDVMEACWQQVGDVLAIEAALSRARLSLEVGLRFRDRHLLPLPEGRLFQVASPLADRTLLGGQTIPRAIGPTSFPDRTADGAMRRYTAATGRVLAGVARRAAREGVTVGVRAAGEALVKTLAAGRPDVDATRFPVLAVDGLPSTMPAAVDEGVELTKFGVGLTIDKASAAALGKASKALTSAPVVSAKDMLAPRVDPRTDGLLTSAHLSAAHEVSSVQLAGVERPLLTDVLGSSSSAVIDAVRLTVAERPGNAGFVIETGQTMVVRPLGLRAGGEIVVLTPPGQGNVVVARIDPRLRGSASEIGELVGRLPQGAIEPMLVRRGGVIVNPRRARAAPGRERRRDPHRAGRRALVVQPDRAGTTVTMPPLVKSQAVIARYESAVSEISTRTVLAVDPTVPELVSFAISQAVVATMERSNPVVVHPARLGTMLTIGGHKLTDLLVDPELLPGWRLPQHFDRVMAYPKLDLPAYTYLADYDRTRFCPGVDEVPPESITLLETNPRFIAGFMGGLNHETNKELLWRSYPTDGRGTPWRKFWKRVDNGPDIFEIHTWGRRSVAGRNRDDLPAQTSDPLGNLVLLLRGDLLRRYPRTMAVAVRAETQHRPSADPADLRTPVFAGQFDPDVSFFGFPLVSSDLTTGEGWFFGLMEPVTEPRFGFDETVGRETATPGSWNDVAWPDLGVTPAGHLAVGQLSAMGLSPAVGQADGIAAALFQRPFKLLVHADHLVKGV